MMEGKRICKGRVIFDPNNPDHIREIPEGWGRIDDVPGWADVRWCECMEDGGEICEVCDTFYTFLHTLEKRNVYVPYSQHCGGSAYNKGECHCIAAHPIKIYKLGLRGG